MHRTQRVRLFRQEWHIPAPYRKNPPRHHPPITRPCADAVRIRCTSRCRFSLPFPPRTSSTSSVCSVCVSFSNHFLIPPVPPPASPQRNVKKQRIRKTRRFFWHRSLHTAADYERQVCGMVGLSNELATHEEAAFSAVLS
jgi:hypothetical protein